MIYSVMQTPKSLIPKNNITVFFKTVATWHLFTGDTMECISFQEHVCILKLISLNYTSKDLIHESQQQFR